MASYVPLTNDAESAKLWATKLLAEKLKMTYTDKFVGMDKNSLIMKLDEPTKGSGDKVTYSLRLLNTAAGKTGTASSEGSEERLNVQSDSLILDWTKKAMRAYSDITDQRVLFNTRKELTESLAASFAEMQDTSLANHLAGNTVETNPYFTGNNTVVAPNSENWIWSGDATTDATLDSADTFDLEDIDRAVEKAKTATPLINPVKTEYGDYYVLFVHPSVGRALRTASSGVNWIDIHKYELAGGNLSKNPIFTGAMGMYNGVVIHEWTRLPNAINAGTNAFIPNTRRSVLCGAQAATCAFGKRTGAMGSYTLNEENFSYKDEYGLQASAIWGLKKSRFNSKDFATITISSYAAGA